jgi:hypothetical protein
VGPVEVAIEDVGSKCLFASVVLWATLTAPGGLAGIFLVRNAINWVASRTGRLFGSGGLAVSEAVPRRNYSRLLSYIEEKANHMQPPASCCNKDVKKAVASGLCQVSLRVCKKVRGLVTSADTEPGVLHMGDQGPLAAEAVVAGRKSRMIEALAVSVRNAKLRSAFWVERESSVRRP